MFSRALVRRRVRIIVAVLCTATGIVGLSSAAVQAALVHPFQGSFGSFTNVQGVAVDASGDVYVYDGGEGEVLRFDASGSPVNFTATGTNAISGVGSAGGGEGEIAVDSSSGPAKGDIYVAHADGSVNIYSAAGAKLGELTEESGHPWGEACGVAVDASGDVYVGLFSEHVNKYVPSANPVTDADFASSIDGLSGVCDVAGDSAGNVFADTWSSGPVTRYEPAQFGSISASGPVVDSKGTTVAVDPASDELYVDEQSQVSQFGAHGEPFEEPALVFGSEGPGAISGSTGIAVSGFNHDVYVSDGKGAISVFGPSVIVPDTTTGAASNVQPTSATLSATVDPSGVPLTECKFEYGTSDSYAQSAPCAETLASIGSGSAPVEVHADLTSLTGGTVYHYRIVAANANDSNAGKDATFATPGAPIVGEESFSQVAGSEAIVSAQIDPDFASTTFHVEYGTTESYDHTTGESEPIGSDNTNHSVSVHISGLVPGTTYHFRFVATNSVSPTNGSDTVFATHPATTASGGCSNEARRDEQDVTSLPDCRAYEMVSPLDKNGSDVIGDGQITDSSLDGNKIAYGAYAGFGEDEGSGVAGITQYVAIRHEGEGWQSRGITPTPAVESFQFLSGATGSNVFSSDLTKAVTFGYDLPAGQEGIPNTENLYVENLSNGALDTISVPHGPETPSIGAVEAALKGSSSDLGVVTFESESNFLPEAQGTLPKLYAWEHGTLRLAGVLPDGSIPSNGSEAGHPGIFNALENEDAISRDGSRIVFMATPNGGSQRQLYLRKDATSTAWVSQPEMAGAVSEPSGVFFDTMTPDGRHVLFVTKDRLLEADPGTSAGSFGLYMYTDGPQPESESNLTFIGRVRSVFSNALENQAMVLGVSNDGTRVYFSTEKDGEFGQSGIYLWENGAPHLISTVKGISAIREPQVSEDGRALAFVTEERLTTAPLAEAVAGMYIYDATTKSLTCASCLPTGGETTAGVELEPKATKSAIATFNGQFRTRFLSENGRYLFFTTAAPLVPADANGRPDVYEYDVETGRVALLSTGTGEDGAWLAAAGADGNDVFILTGQQLLAGDTDNLVDLYDVRIGGGFAQPKLQSSCVGDECQGTPAAAPGFNTASDFTGLGNVNATNKQAVRAKAKTKALTRGQKLARALKACKRKPGKQRQSCRKRAQKRYGAKNARKSTSRRTRR